MSWLKIVVALAAAAACAALPPASASASASDVAVLQDCRERAVIVPGVEKLVRQRVPAQFKLVHDPLGRPLLAVVAGRCEHYSLGGPPQPTTFTSFTAMIESPDGGGCLSKWPVLGSVKPDVLPFCNFYYFFSAYDNPGVVVAQRGAIPELPVYYVPDLAFESREFDSTKLGTPFRFRAAAPTPSPFELNTSVVEGPVAAPATISFWFQGASGTVGGRLEIDDFAPGLMTGTTLRAAPGSEMATLLGTPTPTPLFGLAYRYHHAEATVLPRR